MLNGYMWPFLPAFLLGWRRAGALTQKRALLARVGLIALFAVSLFALSGPPGFPTFSATSAVDLTVLNLSQALQLSELPDWIFIHEMSGSEVPPRVAAAILARYEPVDIPVKEVNFENVPEPYWHDYRSRTDGHGVTFFRKIKATE